MSGAVARLSTLVEAGRSSVMLWPPAYAGIGLLHVICPEQSMLRP